MKKLGILGVIGGLMLSGLDVEGKKIKQSLKVTKEKISAKKEKTASNSDSDNRDSEMIWIPADKDSYLILSDGSQAAFSPDSIFFSGYEKEAGASLETVLISNAGDVAITGVRFKIIYKDLKGRMLHTRTVKKSCHIPSKETRKIDFKSWDKQKSYFYYLGNEPRKVATPYKVEIEPIEFWVER